MDHPTIGPLWTMAAPATARGARVLPPAPIYVPAAKLSQEAIGAFALDADSAPQKYGLGSKELWQVDGARLTPGRVEHYFGWPLPQ